MIRTIAVAVVGLSVFLAPPLAAQQTVSRGTNLSADAARDGRIAIDLAGDIWTVPPRGGTAKLLTPNIRSAQRPRWSPDASEIAYQAVSQGSQGIWIYSFDTGESRHIGRGSSFDIHPAWHPGGERLVYASDAGGAGLDLWEVDLPSGLHWRLSDRPGDESDAAWSSDGRDLVYVHRHADGWSLILRRHGLPEETLLSTADRLAGPSWRPDGSLISYFRDSEAGPAVEIVILAQPLLVRKYARGEAYGMAPISWLDRHRMVYTADGVIRQRLFNAWTSSTLPFQATIEAEKPEASAQQPERRPLPSIDEPDGRLIVHAARMFDGVGGSYQVDLDIISDGGRITAVEPHSDRSNANVIDMGDLTVLPGFIDSLANLAPMTGEFGDRSGPLLLASGVTTIVGRAGESERLNTVWSGKSMPGPRLLNETDWPPLRLQSVADSMTPGLTALLQSRQG
ncbi:MAG: PD40 domain-containing protein, partial [Gammaproteobacteria bacterium]|nr:PD40 domain-containing protein [Gammaproteobacteria bacterium]